jgi:alginate O-acetyltransferase complex protein AlgI
VETRGVLLQSACYVLLFLTCVFVLARVRARHVRQAVLFASSCALYLTWTPWFAAVLATSIVVNFLIGKWLQRNPNWLPLSAGLIFNLALLTVFKYLPALAVHVSSHALHSFVDLALPLGISFWTFQAMSYLFDLYRGDELDPSLMEFAIYMAFFPVTISGPVCRLPEMLPQFRSEEKTAWSEVATGIQRIAIGVLMMQIAKLLGQGILAGDGIVSGFDRTTRWSGADVWCLSFGYGLQLFFDFAGYTHIAVGAAKALGITVPENFERPFASTNPSIFWTRWHMSLSFWIRDYLFFPLATARREVWWRNLALILSMAAFGIWHRASLLFLIWGCYHGVLLVLHRVIQQWERNFEWRPPGKLWTALGWLATAIFISLGWILFRASSPAQAVQMLAATLSPTSYASHFLSLSLYGLVAVLTAGYAVVLLVGSVLDKHVEAARSSEEARSTIALIARWRWFWIPSLYALALLFVFMITHGQQVNAGQLMYRRF